jgi:hypothetical protein
MKSYEETKLLGRSLWLKQNFFKCVCPDLALVTFFLHEVIYYYCKIFCILYEGTLYRNNSSLKQ